MLASTASVYNCTFGGNGDRPTEIMIDDVREITSALVSANAYMILDNIEGAEKFNTAPVRDAYFCLSHSDMLKEIEQIPQFQHKAAYPNPLKTLRSEWGTVANLRFLLSSIGSKTLNGSALNRTVYNNFVVGMEAYANIKQDGYSSTFLYVPPIYSGPLAMNCSIGWKMATCPRITNDLWVLNLRSTLRI
jgi:N4-gp56 family major capsid protein